MSLDPTAPDSELIAEIRGARPGDFAAFESLVRRHQGRVLANCRSLLGTMEDAEDAAQEVFARVYVTLNRFEGRSQFSTWLYRVKVNHCLNEIRRRKKVVLEDIDSIENADNPRLQTASATVSDLDAALDQRRVLAILDAMDEDLRVPLIMCDVDGYSYDEIGHTLGLKLSATKMRVKRARDHFRKRASALIGAAKRTRTAP